MKKTKQKINLIFLSIFMAFSAISMSACSNTTKYSLVSGNLGSIDISNYYIYNYIEFNENDNTYRLENKMKTNEIITKQSGSYLLDNNGIVTITNNEIPTNNFLLCSGEIIKMIDDTLYVSGYIAGYGNCLMTFKK